MGFGRLVVGHQQRVEHAGFGRRRHARRHRVPHQLCRRHVNPEHLPRVSGLVFLRSRSRVWGLGCLRFGVSREEWEPGSEF
eukprot:1852889-Rhodomonas_salina.1